MSDGQARPGKCLQMTANIVEGFCTCFAILSISFVVLFVPAAAMIKGLGWVAGLPIFGFAKGIAAPSAIFAIFCIWGLPDRYSKRRRSKWLDLISRH